MGVSFETYLRRRGDVLMRRRHYVPLRRGHDIPLRRREDVPLRRLDDVPLRRYWVFHLRRTCDFSGTHKETSLRRPHDVLLPGGSYLKIRIMIRDNNAQKQPPESRLAALLQRKLRTQMFSSKYCKNLKNTYFEVHLPM